MSHPDTTATAERTEATLGATGYVLRTRGLKLSGGRLVILSAAEIAAPNADILALIYDTFQLEDYPYTRYRTDGVAIIPTDTSDSALTLRKTTTTLSYRESLNVAGDTAQQYITHLDLPVSEFPRLASAGWSLSASLAVEYGARGATVFDPVTAGSTGRTFNVLLSTPSGPDPTTLPGTVVGQVVANTPATQLSTAIGISLGMHTENQQIISATLLSTAALVQASNPLFASSGVRLICSGAFQAAAANQIIKLRFCRINLS